VEPHNTRETMPETEDVNPKNFFSRLGGAYFSPKSAFQEIGRSPDVLAPIIVLIILGLLMGFYMSKTLDMQSMMPPPRSGMPSGQMGPGANAPAFMPIVMIAAPAIQFIIIALIIAGFAKLFSFFLGVENKFKAVFSVTAYAAIVTSIVRFILIVVILSIRGAEGVSFMNLDLVITSNLGAVLDGVLGSDALPKFVIRLAGAVDVFAIWNIALLAIGYSAVSRKLKTAVAAAWLAAGYLIVAVIGAALSALYQPPAS
jgi:hypothetical protein